MEPFCSYWLAACSLSPCRKWRCQLIWVHLVVIMLTWGWYERRGKLGVCVVEAVWCVWEASGISSTSSKCTSCLALTSTRHLLDLPIRGLFQKIVSLVDQYGQRYASCWLPESRVGSPLRDENRASCWLWDSLTLLRTVRCRHRSLHPERKYQSLQNPLKCKAALWT